MTPEDLARCPVVDGFRQRGMEMTRTETFTDAAFAFAVTLLIISIDAIPRSYDELMVAVQGAPAFGLSFVMLMLVWHAHWGWSRRFGLEDKPTIALSAALVFVVLCYIYPLKMLAQGFVHMATGGAINAGISITLSELYKLFVIYSAGFVLISGLIILLNAHAWRQRDALGLDAGERFDVRAEIGAWTVLGGTGVVSMLLALLTPPSSLVVPGWIYGTLAVTMPVYGVTMTRRRSRLAGPGADRG